ncbi:PACE efflux transporter [Pseudomonas putida]|uniref:PACE efflux transporter n=1 Tax=Pseudomonas putida TaxID=303 RepID=UPI001F52AC6B|nr:PACE efflux transporter [Pseudomonas putida]MCI1024903.1 PACE efflux transporter [Pseudomonas putida]
MSSSKASVSQRVIHAVGYEFFAVLLCAPVMSLLFNKPIESTGTLALMMSAIAMAWNMAYNWFVDRFVQLPRFEWKVWHRLVHGLGFEAGIVVWCLPVAAWMLDITLLKALMLELGFFIFILPYTIAYNWMFDKASARFSRPHGFADAEANR